MFWAWVLSFFFEFFNLEFYSNVQKGSLSTEEHLRYWVVYGDRTAIHCSKHLSVKKSSGDPTKFLHNFENDIYSSTSVLLHFPKHKKCSSKERNLWLTSVKLWIHLLLIARTMPFPSLQSLAKDQILCWLITFSERSSNTFWHNAASKFRTFLYNKKSYLR